MVRIGAPGTWRTLIVFACLAASAFLLLRHAWSLAHRRNQLDAYDVRLAPVKAAVPEGDALRFVTDREGDARLELMLRTQFLLAPRVLHAGSAGNGPILVVDGAEWLRANAAGAEVLCTTGEGSGHLVLLRGTSDR